MASFQYSDLKQLVLCECDEGALVFNKAKATTTVINQQCLYVLRKLIQSPDEDVGQIFRDVGINSDDSDAVLSFLLDAGLIHAKCD